MGSEDVEGFCGGGVFDVDTVVVSGSDEVG